MRPGRRHPSVVLDRPARRSTTRRPAGSDSASSASNLTGRAAASSNSSPASRSTSSPGSSRPEVVPQARSDLPAGSGRAREHRLGEGGQRGSIGDDAGDPLQRHLGQARLEQLGTSEPGQHRRPVAAEQHRARRQRTVRDSRRVQARQARRDRGQDRDGLPRIQSLPARQQLGQRSAREPREHEHGAHRRPATRRAARRRGLLARDAAPPPRRPAPRSARDRPAPSARCRRPRATAATGRPARAAAAPGARPPCARSSSDQHQRCPGAATTHRSIRGPLPRRPPREERAAGLDQRSGATALVPRSGCAAGAAAH